MTLRRRSENPFYLLRVMGITMAGCHDGRALAFQCSSALLSAPVLSVPSFFPLVRQGLVPAPVVLQQAKSGT